MKAIPLSLYIHIPWCVQKCPYCDFNSHSAKQDVDESAYIEALIRDLESDLPRVWGRSLQSIFIGGGTPSLFSGESINRLLESVRARMPISPSAEITLEANPGAIDERHFKNYRDAGVNRLSIGIQSFDDEKLAKLGRIHSSDQAVNAYNAARKAGFENINLDLMFGLPGQTLQQSITDVERALTLCPDHISAYQLTVEPNTAFHHNPPILPDDDTLWEMQSLVTQALESNGFNRYEVSAYARSGQQCRHNRNYWEFGDYLGIGAGAHAKLSEHDRIYRLSKLRHPAEYIAKAGTDDCINENRALNKNDLITEFMMNALRLKDGFARELFTDRTSLSTQEMQEALKDANRKKLVNISGSVIQPSELGYRYLNELLMLI